MLIAYACQPDAIAYANSPTFNTSAALLSERMKAARNKEDKKEIAAIEREGTLRQAMMHECSGSDPAMPFGAAS